MHSTVALHKAYEIYPLGDHALTIPFGEEINLPVNQKVQQLFRQLQANPIRFVVDIIPAYTTLTLVYNLEQALQACTNEQTPFTLIKTQVLTFLENAIEQAPPASSVITIPVCYDMGVAPDLQDVAQTKGLSTEEVIAIHSQPIYHVYMIGFQPGFPYMASVDERIAMSRHSSPRTQVPAGSVAIAGEQTGIYPFSSPGGWHIIGRTPVQMFSANNNHQPTNLQPGDQVRFEPIPLQTFYKLQQA